MYTKIFFVTSVRGIFLPPQIAASGSLKAFGAKIPTSRRALESQPQELRSREWLLVYLIS